MRALMKYFRGDRKRALIKCVEVTSNPAHKKSQKGAGVGTPGAHSDG